MSNSQRKHKVLNGWVSSVERQTERPGAVLTGFDSTMWRLRIFGPRVNF